MTINGSNIGYGLPLKDPELIDVLYVLQRKILLDLFSVHIATVTSVNLSTRTLNAQIAYQKVLADGTVIPYPAMNNCPFITIQGGGGALQLPVSSGDSCLLLFNDRSMSDWCVNGPPSPPQNGPAIPDERLHDPSDAIALVGLNWESDSRIPTASSSEARLVYSGSKFGLSGGKATVSNGTITLLTVLQKLITGILALTASGVQVVDSSGDVTAAQAQLSELLY